jgi:hypothetical protein
LFPIPYDQENPVQRWAARNKVGSRLVIARQQFEMKVALRLVIAQQHFEMNAGAMLGSVIQYGLVPTSLPIDT